MEPKIVFVPDPFLHEGSTTVHDMVRMARTQPRDTPPIGSRPPTARSVAMAQHQPRYMPDPAPQHDVPNLAPRLSLTRPSGALSRHVHQALDRFADDLAYVEELTLDAGLTASRIYLETDQMTTGTLDISYRRREGVGFADADEKTRWLQGRRCYQDLMGDITDASSHAVRDRFIEALDQQLQPPPPPSKLVAFLRDGSWR